jgi:hypothetical protein
MEQLRYEFILKAMNPIAHSEKSIGNASITMMRRIMRPNGTDVRVPIITAGTMRHKMRESSSNALLRELGLLDVDGTLTAAGVRFLFNGGMLTKVGKTETATGKKAAVDLPTTAALMKMIPTLPLFGGCANNRLIPGQLQVEDAYLICEETEHLWPAWVKPWLVEAGVQVNSLRTHVEVEMRVRNDAMNDPSKRRLLTGDERVDQQDRLIEREIAHEEDDAAAAEASKGTMMPRTTEVIVGGSLYVWSVTATLYDALQQDAFNVAVFAFLANAVVGGQAGTGHGRIAPMAAERVQLATGSDAMERMDLLKTVAPRAGELFRRHVKENSSAIRDALASVQA